MTNVTSYLIGYIKATKDYEMYAIVTTVETFGHWLMEEMKTRDWSMSELARRCNVSHVAISRLINGERRPGDELCHSIANALGIPVVQVFRRAGKLPPAPDRDESIERILFYYDQMSKDDQARLLKLAEALASYETGEGEGEL
jgi:transcriptional regulator with XRE-family HTH domain